MPLTLAMLLSAHNFPLHWPQMYLSEGQNKYRITHYSCPDPQIPHKAIPWIHVRGQGVSAGATTTDMSQPENLAHGGFWISQLWG